MGRLTFGTLFSGVEGAGLGLQQAGFDLIWQCEIDQKASNVLRYHSDVPNYGDVRTFPSDDVEVPDLLWWSPPCQDVSVAGKRKGLKGEKSGLFYDASVHVGRLRERGLEFAIMEQVPGILSSHAGEDFRAVLQTLLDIGAVDIGWRILDAQWSGVAQRRRRLFVAVDFRGRRAEQILDLSQGRSGNPAKSGRSRKNIASTASDGTGASSRLCADVSPTLLATGQGTGRPAGIPCESDFLVAVPETARALRSQSQLAHQEDADTLIPMLAKCITAGMHCLDAEVETFVVEPTYPPQSQTSASEDEAICIKGAAIGRAPKHGPQFGDYREDQSFCLQTSEIHAVAFSTKQDGSDSSEDVAPTLRAMGHDESHANGGGQLGVAIGFPSLGINDESECGLPMNRVKNPPAVATEDTVVYGIQPTNSGKNYRAKEIDVSQSLMSSTPSFGNQGGDLIVRRFTVRRLTPTECERLMGWPDGHTLYGKKEDGKVYKQKDNARYMQCGNGVVSPVSKWIGLKVAALLRSEG